MATVKVFVHGLESSAKGTKGSYFAANFRDMILENYSGSAAKRLQKLTSLLENAPSAIIVGSSYGGLVSAIYAYKNPERVKRLILLAPALDDPEFSKYRAGVIPVETFIFHGAQDDIVSPKTVKEIASSCFSNLHHHLVTDDHSLTATFSKMDWKSLLSD